MMDFHHPEKTLDLENIRSTLIRLEDTILFHLIERAQFFQSSKVYQPGAFESLGGASFLEWLLRRTESVHSQLRRYYYPDENPFFQDGLREPVIPVIDYPPVLAKYSSEINVNSKLLDYYIKTIVPDVAAGDEEEPDNYGSCALSDIQVLQALSRRIHFGKFVAEAKFRQEKSKLVPIIEEQNAEKIMQLITKPEVERQVSERVREKALKYTTSSSENLRWPQGSPKLDPEVVVTIYENCIIPLTKKVEVDYLLRRLEDSF